VIPRGQNQIVDSLATSTSIFKIPIFRNKIYEIEVEHIPIVFDNSKYCQVFEYDKKIESFLKMEGEFKNLNIDEEYCCEEEDAVVFANDDYFKNHIVGKDIVQLKNNIIPKGLVPLEKLFDNNDVSGVKIIVNDGDVEDCNIGTQEDPNIIKLSKTLRPKVKQSYINLMK
jgi:hypothetical protein